MIIEMEEITLQERGVVGLWIRVKEFVPVTLETKPDFPAKGEIPSASKRNVFNPVPQIDPLTWIGEKTIVFIVAEVR